MEAKLTQDPNAVTKGLMPRHKLLVYMQCKTDEGNYHLLENFTECNTSKNPVEYNRKYVERSGEDSDVTGYSPSKSFAFDRVVGDKCQDDIVEIEKNELVGDDAVRDFIEVDFSEPVPSESGKFYATQRKYSIIMDSYGSDANVLTYTGNFKSKGESKRVKVQTSDDWQTVTITA